MNSIVKFTPSTKIKTYLRPENPDSVKTDPTALGVEMKAVRAILLSGENKGEEVEDVKVGQVVSLETTGIKPYRYQPFVTPNPALFELGAPRLPTYILPERNQIIRVVLKAEKAFKVSELEYLVGLLLVD